MPTSLADWLTVLISVVAEREFAAGGLVDVAFGVGVVAGTSFGVVAVGEGVPAGGIIGVLEKPGVAGTGGTLSVA